MTPDSVIWLLSGTKGSFCWHEYKLPNNHFYATDFYDLETDVNLFLICRFWRRRWFWVSSALAGVEWCICWLLFALLNYRPVSEYNDWEQHGFTIIQEDRCLPEIFLTSILGWNWRGLLFASTIYCFPTTNLYFFFLFSGPPYDILTVLYISMIF